MILIRNPYHACIENKAGNSICIYRQKIKAISDAGDILYMMFQSRLVESGIGDHFLQKL